MTRIECNGANEVVGVVFARRARVKVAYVSTSSLNREARFHEPGSNAVSHLFRGKIDFIVVRARLVRLLNSTLKLFQNPASVGHMSSCFYSAGCFVMHSVNEIDDMQLAALQLLDGKNSKDVRRVGVSARNQLSDFCEALQLGQVNSRCAKHDKDIKKLRLQVSQDRCEMLALNVHFFGALFGAPPLHLQRKRRVLACFDQSLFLNQPLVQGLKCLDAVGDTTKAGKVRLNVGNQLQLPQVSTAKMECPLMQVFSIGEGGFAGQQLTGPLEVLLNHRRRQFNVVSSSGSDGRVRPWVILKSPVVPQGCFFVRAPSRDVKPMPRNHFANEVHAVVSDVATCPKLVSHNTPLQHPSDRAVEVAGNYTAARDETNKHQSKTEKKQYVKN